MHRTVDKLGLTFRFVSGIALVLVFTVFAFRAHADIEINGLFWGDEDYMEYNFVSDFDSGRAFLYQKLVDSGTMYVLVRVSYETNDNAFSPNTDYTASVGWNDGHLLSDLIETDYLEMFMECGSHRWEWRQDLIYNSGGPGEPFEWRSDTMGDDGVEVYSPTDSVIPTSGIITALHSSLEYNLENSSWMLNQAGTDPDYWTSPDINEINSISIVEVPHDINTITGEHEDYPFFLSTDSSSTDLYEWAISYEMSLDVSHCNPNEVVIGVANIHNSPSKNDYDGDRVADIEDLCPDTTLPEPIPTVGLRGKRYADIDGDGVFESGNSMTNQMYSMVDTGGCSAEQIIDQMQLGRGHVKYGLSDSVLRAWIALLNGQ
jgi:hypothetical protein